MLCVALACLLGEHELHELMPVLMSAVGTLQKLNLESNTLRGLVLMSRRVIRRSSQPHTGAIPPSIGNFTDLKELILRSNELQGSHFCITSSTRND